MPDEAGDEESKAGRNASPAGLIYGVLTIATVIATESTRRETFPKLLAASALALVLYWVAHAYAHHWGSRLEDPKVGVIAEALSALVHESTILAGASLPAAVLVVAWITGASKETGVTAVLWCTAIEVVVLEVLIGARHRLRAFEIASRAVVGVGLGLGILGLRLLLH